MQIREHFKGSKIFVTSVRLFCTCFVKAELERGWEGNRMAEERGEREGEWE